MILEERIKKAKQLNFRTILSSGTEVGTWGSKDNFYRISLTKRTERTIQLSQHHVTVVENIQVECIQHGKDCNCQGNSHRSICYHAMGALMFVLNNRGQEIEFCRDQFVAQSKVEQSEWDRNVNNYHFASINSKSGRGWMWAVIRDKMKVVDHGDMENRISSMRGNEIEEEGID